MTKHVRLFVLPLLLLPVGPQAAQADLVLTFSDDGTDTTIQVSGSFDTTGLAARPGSATQPGLFAHDNSHWAVFNNSGVSLQVDLYGGLGVRSGDDFNTLVSIPTVSAGLDGFGLVASSGGLAVPQGYAGETLNITGQITGETLFSLGLPAIFSSTMSYADAAGGTGDSVTWTAVPEPSALLYGGIISMLAGCGCWLRRRTA